jgi:hypothetical protein
VNAISTECSNCRVAELKQKIIEGLNHTVSVLEENYIKCAAREEMFLKSAAVAEVMGQRGLRQQVSGELKCLRRIDDVEIVHQAAKKFHTVFLSYISVI